MENNTTFRYVDNLNDYIEQNNLKWRMASKFQRVNAQPGAAYINQYIESHPELSGDEIRGIRQNGAPLTTIASDGTRETDNLVTNNHVILNNVGNPENRWAVDADTFKRKYQPSDEGKNVYRPAGKPMLAYEISEPISFTAPWGEVMYIDRGGYLMQDPDNQNDIYGISAKDFAGTYKFQESGQRANGLGEAYLRKVIESTVNEALRDLKMI